MLQLLLHAAGLYSSCSTASAVAAPGALLLPPSGYDCNIGAGLQGGDIFQAEGLTLAEAEQWCMGNASCAAFTFQHNTSNCTRLETTAGSRTGLNKVFFKSGASTNTDHDWRTFAKANFTPSLKPHPSYRGCDSPPGSLLGWCNHGKSHSERLELLLGQLTLPEKIGLLSPTPALGNPCNTHTAGAPRLGLSDYMWLEESNTGVSSACLGPGHCATTFSGPLGLGASFNRSSWYMKGTVIGNELRAMNNIGWFRDAGGTTTEKLGLTGYGKRANKARPKLYGHHLLTAVLQCMWNDYQYTACSIVMTDSHCQSFAGPNINQPRDPRFGRLSELPSEDPLHAGLYAANFVQGMQEEDAAGHPKMIALLKHFVAYSQETGRGHDVENISHFDLFDSYLPQYKIAFDGGASGAMCSYNSPLGQPSCANGYLLNEIIRTRWNFSDILVS
jgi:beta-glucosidase-like glycosyl hydrolase